MTEDTLQLAIQEHQKGNYEKAEKHYRTILISEPNHPHANHNLGLLVRFVLSPEEALPHLQKALEVNINEEQFWISYIETLLQANQIEKAIQIANDAKSKINEKNYVNLTAQINEYKKKGLQNNPFIEINRLVTLYNNNLYDEAENKAKKLTELHPQHNIPWKMLGVLLSRKEKWTGAQKAFLKTLEITPNDEETLSNLAAVQQELGLIVEAKHNAIKALELNFNYAQAHYNLGRAHYELGELTNAESNYKKAIELNPNYADAYCNLGLTLDGAGRALEAVEFTKKAITLKPDLHQAQHNLGVWLLSLKQYKEAEIELKKSVELKKDNEENLLSCYFHQNKEKEFYKLLESLAKTDRISSLLGSLCSRAELRYSKKTVNSYCTKPMDYVVEGNLLKSCDFKKIFIKPLKEISDNLKEQRLQGLLTNGKQSSGNLFITDADITKDIQNIIHAEIQKYRDHFKNSKEGLIQKWPKKYKLYGWLVTMKNGGNLSAHMHETGWISGSIYINVPAKIKKDSGNIAFCIEEEKFLKDGQKGPEKNIDVTTGSICLFPSSLLHYTIPFESEEERIVLAFDVQPDE